MLGKLVKVKVTAPMYSTNRNRGYVYMLNFGIIEDMLTPRGGVMSAYIMGISHPVKRFDGRVIAVVRRHGAKGVVYVVAPKSTRFIVNDIKPAIAFAEKDGSYDIECLFERSCGAVVYRDNESRQVLLIKNKRSAHWGFPKGHIEPGETQVDTAIRETKEETGLDIEIIDGFSAKSEYSIQGKIEKSVVIFLARTLSDEVTVQQEEIDAFVWADFDTAMRMLRFENDKNILNRAVEFIKSRQI